jgi:hypothetical protein
MTVSCDHGNEPPGSTNGGEFDWVTTGFSRRTLPHRVSWTDICHLGVQTTCGTNGAVLALVQSLRETTENLALMVTLKYRKRPVLRGGGDLHERSKCKAMQMIRTQSSSTWHALTFKLDVSVLCKSRCKADCGFGRVWINEANTWPVCIRWRL